MLIHTPDTKIHFFSIRRCRPHQLPLPLPNLHIHIRLEVPQSPGRKRRIEILPLPLVDDDIASGKHHGTHLEERIIERALGEAALVAVDLGQRLRGIDRDMVGSDTDDGTVGFVDGSDGL
jgi:hypothetical protein